MAKRVGGAIQSLDAVISEYLMPHKPALNTVYLRLIFLEVDLGTSLRAVGTSPGGPDPGPEPGPEPGPKIPVSQILIIILQISSQTAV